MVRYKIAMVARKKRKVVPVDGFSTEDASSATSLNIYSLKTAFMYMLK
jgi:hypothetical protein